jgi:hypothetical protein
VTFHHPRLQAWFCRHGMHDNVHLTPVGAVCKDCGHQLINHHIEEEEAS